MQKATTSVAIVMTQPATACADGTEATTTPEATTASPA